MNLMSPAKLITCLLFIVSVLSSSANGFYFRSQDEIYLSGDFEEDVFLAGSTVNFDGNIIGDLFMASNTATFNGEMDGNLHTAGWSVTVNGFIERSYRASAWNININADIGGDAIAFCQQLTFSSDSRIGRDAAIFCAQSFINGTIERDAYIYAGEVTIAGKIDGSVTIEAEEITIQPTAYIGGDVEYKSAKKANISSEAQIMGAVKWDKETSASGKGDFLGLAPPPTGWIWSLIFLLGSLIIGIVIVAVKRTGAVKVVDEIKSNGLIAGALGLAVIIVGPILVGLFAISIVGLPLAVVSFAGYTVLFWIGKVFVGIALGVWLLGLMRKEGQPSLGWALIVGMILLALLFKIPVLGWLIYVVAWALGAGALMMVFFRRYRDRRQPPPASATTGQSEATT